MKQLMNPKTNYCKYKCPKQNRQKTQVGRKLTEVSHENSTVRTDRDEEEHKT